MVYFKFFFLPSPYQPDFVRGCGLGKVHNLQGSHIYYLDQERPLAGWTPRFPDFLHSCARPSHDNSISLPCTLGTHNLPASPPSESPLTEKQAGRRKKPTLWQLLPCPPFPPPRMAHWVWGSIRVLLHSNFGQLLELLTIVKIVHTLTLETRFKHLLGGSKLSHSSSGLPLIHVTQLALH